MNMQDAAALGELVDWLSRAKCANEIRMHLGHQLLGILKADFYASFVWDDEARAFGQGVALNMDACSIALYEEYYQFHNPLTPLLQGRRIPTLVDQIIPRQELMRTEFFHDFLSRDGLYYGANLYVHDQGRNIGDMRIWRSKGSGAFDQTALVVLAVVQPVLEAALKRTMVRPEPVSPLRTLSKREQAIAQCVWRGLGDKQIAQELGIEFSTVRTHLARIFEKLGVRSRTQVIQTMLEAQGSSA